MDFRNQQRTQIKYFVLEIKVKNDIFEPTLILSVNSL